MFGKGNLWQIWWITGGLPNFAIQILTMSCDLSKESKQTGFCTSFARQKFLIKIHQSFPPPNEHSHYSVAMSSVLTPWNMSVNNIYIYIMIQTQNVTGFMKTNPNRTFGISRITNLKYLTHCESLVLGYSHTKITI